MLKDWRRTDEWGIVSIDELSWLAIAKVTELQKGVMPADYGVLMA